MIGISAGILLTACLPLLPSVWMLGVLAVLAGGTMLYLVQQKSYNVGNIIKHSGILVQFVGLLLGVLYASLWGSHQLNQHLMPEQGRIDAGLTGIVEAVEVSDPGFARFIFSVQQIDTEVAPALQKVVLSWYRPDQPVEVGQQWYFATRLKPVTGFSNPGGYDYETRMFSEGIGAKGYIRNQARLLEQREPDMIIRWRNGLTGWIDRLALTKATNATLKALFLGDKGGISDDQWRLLQDTGTVHLIIISGMHIGIVCTLGYGLGYLLQWLFRFRAGSYDLRWLRVATALLLATLYAVLSGFGIPAQRALVMAGALLLPGLLNHNLSLWQRYSLALMMVLILQPLSIYQSGFWLSFVAVGALIFALNRHQGNVLFTLFRSQWVILLALTPVLLFWNGSASVVAPLINLLAIPYLTFILIPIGILGLILSPLLPFLATPLLNGVCGSVWWLLEQALSLVDLQIRLQPSLLSTLLAIVGAALLLLPRWLTFQRFGWLMFLPLITSSKDLPADGQFRATVIDVGQGLSVLIETAEGALLYDTGAGYRSGGNAARYSIVPLMNYKQITSLDRLIISHGDMDHDGGYPEITSEFRVGLIESGSPDWIRRKGVNHCSSGSAWQRGGVRFSYIHPPEAEIENENNRSCVLLVESEHCSLLIPGDIETSVEQQILQQYPGLEVEWLVAAHHGSRSSTSSAWLYQLQPDAVFISAGRYNSYNHPAPEVVAEFQRSGIPWRNTSEAGAILLESHADGCFTNTFRSQKKRYWSAG